MRDQLLQGPEGESPHDFASYDYLRGPVGLPLSPVLEATRGPSRGGVDDDDMASADANVKHELDGGHLAPPPSSASKGKMKSKMKGQSLGPGADDGGGGGGGGVGIGVGVGSGGGGCGGGGGGGSGGNGGNGGSSGAAAASLNNRKEWASREDELIWRGVQQIGCKWRQIAVMLPGRSDDAVRNRYNRLKEAEASGLVRSDSGVTTEAHAAGSLSGGGGGGGGGTGTYRCSKCGQLKKNHVCTAVATGDAWPKSDDAIITHSVQELGHRWYQIAERLPGRTDHAIRNRWHRLLTMRQEELSRAEAGGGRGAAPGSAPIPMPVADEMDADAAADGAGVSMANEDEVEVLPPPSAPEEEGVNLA